MLQEAKLHRFRELGEEIAQVFEPAGLGGTEQQLCQVCGSEHVHIRSDQEAPDEEEVRKCWPCCSYETLGDDLRTARFLVFEKRVQESPAAEADTYQQVFEDLGWDAYVSEDLPVFTYPAQRVLLALDEPARAELKPTSFTALGRRFIVNTTPLISNVDIERYQQKMKDRLYEGSIKPFDLLQEQSEGIKRLGVLRMDVDNLSKLFAEGLGQGATLARVASLSFAVSLYFEGWVGKLAGDLNKEVGDKVYSIYSGGDDLFFVGAWDAVVELARRIRRDLTSFAAQHPGVHTSAGIVLVGGKYPLAQAAEDAADAEDRAKRNIWYENQHKRTKDSLTFLGQTLPWKQVGLEDENCEGFEDAFLLMRYFTNRKKELHPLLNRLMSFQEMYEEAAEKRRRTGLDRNQNHQPQTLWGPWNWLSVYTLSRLAKQTGNRDIRTLNQRLKDDHFQSIEWIGLAARWAELYMRQKESTRGNDDVK